MSNNSYIETRSIDPIPDSERHGSAFSQFTLWLGANLQITAIVTGALAIVFGGDVFWSLIGLAIGQIAGGVVMALHAAQGPQLGIPQMISSRVQFGVYGACLPILLVCLMYLGFIATGAVLSGQAISALCGVSETSGIMVFALATLIIAYVGYRLIHLLGKLASLVGIVAFVYLFWKISTLQPLSTLITFQPFRWSSFLTAVGLSASWQITFGPYVADYSRYLPRSTPSRRVFLAVGSGSVIGAQIAMTVGVLAAAMSQGKLVGHEVDYIVGLGGSGAVATLLYLSIAFGKLTINTLNAYGSLMCLTTVYRCGSGAVQISRRVRLLVLAAIILVATGLAILGQHAFLAAFKSFLLFLLTFFTPWSAVNLVDYYGFNHRDIDTAALNDPRGKYRAWNATGLGVYIMGVVIQTPFIDSGFYSGPLVKLLGGIDISWIIGLVVPAVVYYVLRKRQVSGRADDMLVTD
ncbi:cytosine permease [Shimwellia pseudoproteus]|uniref:purine-cytosine permease family protein n=1 Tax=Shimwellia pseudoproteus TaxID=570012 RepID=UPI0018ECF435|nr:cytosine permease [Shimwellia pseudoproteus]MBJ3814955.1 cytosine permease [Shimwellia pseudoproteus]